MVGEVRAGTTSPMPDQKGFKLLELVNFQKFSTLRVNVNVTLCKSNTICNEMEYYSRCSFYSILLYIANHGTEDSIANHVRTIEKLLNLIWLLL